MTAPITVNCIYEYSETQLPQDTELMEKLEKQASQYPINAKTTVTCTHGNDVFTEEYSAIFFQSGDELKYSLSSPDKSYTYISADALLGKTAGGECIVVGHTNSEVEKDVRYYGQFIFSGNYDDAVVTENGSAYKMTFINAAAQVIDFYSPFIMPEHAQNRTDTNPGSASSYLIYDSEYNLISRYLSFDTNYKNKSYNITVSTEYTRGEFPEISKAQLQALEFTDHNRFFQGIRQISGGNHA